MAFMSGRSMSGPDSRCFAAVTLCASMLPPRWHLDDIKLSPGDVVGQPSVWQHGHWVIAGGVLVILTLASLVAYLLYKQKQLARARREQMKLSGMLINAHEDERKRLASELHDDFSQRLALLSLGIETAADGAPAALQAQLNELLNSASEIGADIHTLSHRLHSSTLERLGLVPGVGSYCKEFTAQQGIPVIFSHADVPRSVPPEVSLCLFRIVQEALRNVKKHSRASAAKVRLAYEHGELHLTIVDDGAGFDARQVAVQEGLGILSMEQRARLIGARFAVISGPQRGTRIEVFARFQAKLRPNMSLVAEASEMRSAKAVGSR